MKKLYLHFIALIALCPLLTIAQKQAERWYFGQNAGINFNSGAPVAVFDGALSTSEGCSSIADNNGNLLFYTDGITVFNKQHSTMPNGTNLTGDISSTQSALIVPLPGNANIYYIFTTDADGDIQGFRYSIVDMTLNGGLGDVTQKNILIKTPITEKVTAVSKRGGGYWIMSHEWGSDAFLAYRLNSTGFDTAAVVSHSGTVHSTSAIQNTYGQMKFSPGGDKLALGIGYQGIFELFDFNDSSGVVSNPVSLSTGQKCYGLEFSPDNTKLYINPYDNVNDTYWIDQLDLSSGVAATILASRTNIITSSTGLRQMQLGPDKKIYIAKAFNSYLAAIENPNALGAACNYNDTAVYLDFTMSALGLPGFVQSIFREAAAAAFATSDTFICPGSCINFRDLSLNQPSNWQWRFPGATPDSSSQQNPQNICYNTPGNYPATLIVGNDAGYDTLTISNAVQVYPLVPVSVTVNGDTFTAFNGTAYQWFLNGVPVNGATSGMFIATEAGDYTVQVTDANGCNGLSNPITFTPTAVSELQAGKVAVFPVPAANVLFIKTQNTGIKVQDIAVYNALGKQLAVPLSSNGITTALDVSQLPGGYYVIKYRVNSISHAAPFIKE